MRKTITILFGMIAIISCNRTDYMDIPQSLLFTADCTPSPVSKAGGEALWSAGGDLVSLSLHECGTVPAATKAAPVTEVYVRLGLFGYRYVSWSSSCRPALTEDGLLEKHASGWQTAEEILTGPVGTGLKMRFYSYGPYRAEGLGFSCEDGAPVLHYEVPASVGDQADLIAGKSAELPADASSVSLHFDHILSAVTFAVDASCTAATVKRISLENVYAAADYGWSSGWSGHSGKSTFSLDLSAAVEEGSAADLTGGGNTMMLLPQTFAEDARIVLTLEVDGEEVVIATSLAGVTLGAGKAYTFRMNFDASPYDSIFTYHILMSHEVNIFKSTGENLWLPEMKFESGTEKITVDWGDGTSQTVTSGTAVFRRSFRLNYEGDVIVKVKGTSPKIVISGGHIQRIQKINIEGSDRYDSRDGSNCIIETSTNTLVYAGIDYSIPPEVTTLGPYCMATVEDATLRVPEGITTIRENAISGPNPYMHAVELPASLTLLEDGAFKGNGLDRAKVAPGNPVYDSRNDDSCIMVTATDYIIFGTKRMVIPAVTKGIRPYACMHTPSNITLPPGCLNLMKYSFASNQLLRKIVFPAGCSIGFSAFSGDLFAEFDFSAGGIWAGQYAFSSCPGIVALDLSDFAGIGHYCFRDCRELIALNIPEGTVIPEEAFSLCEKLTSLTIPAGCTLKKNAFSYCTGLKTLDLYSSLGGRGTFKFCTALETVNIHDGFSTYADDDFYLTGVTCINNYCHEQPIAVKCYVHKPDGVMHVLEGQDYTLWMATCGFTEKGWTWIDDLEEP